MVLSLIIPCFNEEKVIKTTYREIVKNLMEGFKLKPSFGYELIFVDDGSKDGTMSAIKEFASVDRNVRYISFSRNFGKEAAMIAGLSYCKGDCAIIMDADLQHPPELIPKMVKLYEQGYEQVIAMRDREGEGKKRSALTRAYYKLVNKMVDVELKDGVGDFRLLSRKAIDAVLSLNEYNRFSKGIFSWIGFKQATIKYHNRQRAAGETKWSFKKLFNYGLDGIMSFNNKPLRACFGIGIISALVAIVILIVTLIRNWGFDIPFPGYFTPLFAILLIGGIQLFAVGILGEYIGRIYYETKQRPHFIVDDTNIKQEEAKKWKQ